MKDRDRPPVQTEASLQEKVIEVINGVISPQVTPDLFREGVLIKSIAKGESILTYKFPSEAEVRITLRMEGLNNPTELVQLLVKGMRNFWGLLPQKERKRHIKNGQVDFGPSPYTAEARMPVLQNLIDVARGGKCTDIVVPSLAKN